jgi:hypothetical protein
MQTLSVCLNFYHSKPISSYSFANIAEHVSSVSQAYQHLCMSHHSKPSYENNLLKGYAVLNRQKCGQGLKGLTGKSYNELLAMLCR